MSVFSYHSPLLNPVLSIHNCVLICCIDMTVHWCYYDRPLVLASYVQVILPEGEEDTGGGRWKIVFRHEIE